MKPEEYTRLVTELARAHVCEGKALHKMVAKTVMKLDPMTVLANSLREPTDEQIQEVVEQHNPFASEDIPDALLPRYTAICKLQLDAEAAVAVYREERHVPVKFRILEVSKARYLTWLEADPSCDDVDDDKMAEFDSLQTAKDAAQNYTSSMQLIGTKVEVAVIGFNRYHERIA